MSAHDICRPTCAARRSEHAECVCAELDAIEQRDESDSCQRSTPGCSVDHRDADTTCETW